MDGGEGTPVLEASSPEMRTTSTPVHEREVDESRLSASPNLELVEARIPPLLNRTIPGSCCAQNRGSLSWGADGCISLGCGSLVVVVEAASAQYLQVLNKHMLPVTRTAWAPADQKRLCLASADTGGHIFIWNVVQGFCVKQLQDGNLPIPDLRWLEGSIENTGHLLLAVHPPNHLVLWNTATGAKVWKSSYNEPILGFDMDPFHCSRLMFLSHHCVLFIDDFHPEKCPKSEGTKFYIMNGKVGSPGRTGVGDAPAQAEERPTKGTKLSKIMRQMVLGETRQLHQQASDSASECLSATFHRAVKDLILLAFPKQVLLVDVKLSQAVGTINLERVHSSLAGIRSRAEKDLIYILHESGSVSVWRKKSNLSVLATPSMHRSSASALLCRTPLQSCLTVEGYDLAGSDVLLEVSYESKVQSDHVRMGKNCKVLGFALHPISEKHISFLTSDGRIYMLDYLENKPSEQEQEQSIGLPKLDRGPETTGGRLMIRSILGSTSSTLTTVRMCPALTLKNLSEYVPLVAAGSTNGNILVFNVATGGLVRELAVHTGEVRQLEWTSGNPAKSCISCSFHPVTGSTLVRNELIHTNILTGKTRLLRTDRGEEPKITMIRVSHGKQYFVLAFSSGPFELWDAQKLCLLRTMPKKFPPVTAVSWSPNHRSRKKDVSGETESLAARLENGLPVKEHILFTDLDSQLYHFSVEGHSIRDGTRIPAETGIGTINAIACKTELIVRGDSDGNINIWNIKGRQSKNIHTGRGNIRELKFSPGRGNMKVLVLYTDGVAVWDVKELELISEVRSGKDVLEVTGVDWVASDRVLLLCRDGSIRVMGLALAGAASSALKYFRDQMLSTVSILPANLLSKLAFNSTFPKLQVDLLMDTDFTPDQSEYNIIKTYQEMHQSRQLSFIERNIEFAHLFGLSFEKKFWNIIYHREKNSKLSTSYDIYCDRKSYLEMEEEKSKLHLNRATDRNSRSRVTARLLCLGEIEPAVKLLLETEPSEETFLSDQLLACLVSTTISAVDGNHMSTTKMVATKLIAEGRLWEGVNLLCLVDKVWDACTYLRASKNWEESLWLGKCRLSTEEYIEITKKYSDYLINQGRIQEAALLHASTENWSACLEVLHLGQYKSLAVRLLHHLGNIADPVLCEAVWLEAARFLFEVGQRTAAEHFTEKIGKKGAELREEFLHVK